MADYKDDPLGLLGGEAPPTTPTITDDPLGLLGGGVGDNPQVGVRSDTPTPMVFNFKDEKGVPRRPTEGELYNMVMAPQRQVDQVEMLGAAKPTPTKPTVGETLKENALGAVKALYERPASMVNAAAGFLSWPAPLAGGLTAYVSELLSTLDPSKARVAKAVVEEEIGKWLPRLPNTDRGAKEEEIMTSPLRWGKDLSNAIISSLGIRKGLPGKAGAVIDDMSDIVSEFMSAALPFKAAHRIGRPAIPKPESRGAVDLPPLQEVRDATTLRSALQEYGKEILPEWEARQKVEALRGRPQPTDTFKTREEARLQDLIREEVAPTQPMEKGTPTTPPEPTFDMVSGAKGVKFTPIPEEAPINIKNPPPKGSGTLNALRMENGDTYVGRSHLEALNAAVEGGVDIEGKTGVDVKHEGGVEEGWVDTGTGRWVSKKEAMKVTATLDSSLPGGLLGKEIIRLESELGVKFKHIWKGHDIFPSYIDMLDPTTKQTVSTPIRKGDNPETIIKSMRDKVANGRAGVEPPALKEEGGAPPTVPSSKESPHTITAGEGQMVEDRLASNREKFVAPTPTPKSTTPALPRGTYPVDWEQLRDLDPSTYPSIRNRNTGEIRIGSNHDALFKKTGWKVHDSIRGWVRAPEGVFRTETAQGKWAAKEQMKRMKESKDRGTPEGPKEVDYTTLMDYYRNLRGWKPSAQEGPPAPPHPRPRPASAPTPSPAPNPGHTEYGYESPGSILFRGTKKGVERYPEGKFYSYDEGYAKNYGEVTDKRVLKKGERILEINEDEMSKEFIKLAKEYHKINPNDQDYILTPSEGWVNFLRSKGIAGVDHVASGEVVMFDEAPAKKGITTPVPGITAIMLDDGTKLMKVGAATPEEVAIANQVGPSRIRKVGEFVNGDWKWDEAPPTRKAPAPTPSMEEAARLIRDMPEGDVLGLLDEIGKGFTESKGVVGEEVTPPPLKAAHGRKRKVSDTLKDIGEVLSSKVGMTIEDVGKGKKREEALGRLREDYSRFQALAESEMRDVGDYLKERGFTPRQIASMELASTTPAPKPEQDRVRKGIVQEVKERAGASDLVRSDPIAVERSLPPKDLEGLKKAATLGLKRAKADGLLRSLEKSVVTSAGQVIGRETETGRKMVDLIQSTYEAGERRGGEWEAGYLRNVKGLTPAEKANLVSTLDGNAKPINDRVRAAVEAERSRLNEVAKEAGASNMTVLHPKVREWKIEGEKGNWKLLDENDNLVVPSTNKAALEAIHRSFLKTPFHERENYFPRMVKREALESRIDEAIQHLINTDQVEKVNKKTGEIHSKEVQKEIARSKLNVFIRRNSERRFGNLQIARELDLPDWAYEHNPDVVLPIYYSKSGMRIEQAKGWGARDQVLYDHLARIVDEGGDGQFAQRMLDRILFKEPANVVADSVVRKMTGYQVLTKMGLSQISQVTQRLSALVRTNARSVVKAQWEMWRHSEEAQDWFIRSGSGVRGVSQLARNELMGGHSNLSDWYLEKTRFTQQDIRSRLIANLSGRFYAEFLSDKLNAKPSSTFARRRMEQMGLNPDEVVGRRLTEKELLRASQKAEIDSNFRNRTLDLPEFWTSRWGRVVTQFNSFIFAQTRFLRDFVVKEGVKGNLMPLTYLLVGGQVLGEAVNNVRGGITGRDRTPNMLKRMLENLSVVGALGVFEKAFSTARYGEPPFGATATTIGKGIGSIAGIVKGDWKPGAKFVAGEVPIVGGRLKHEVEERTQTPASKSNKKKEENYWKTHPWSVRGVVPGTPPKTLRSVSGGGVRGF